MADYPGAVMVKPASAAPNSAYPGATVVHPATPPSAPEPSFGDRVGAAWNTAWGKVQADLPNLSNDPRVGNPGHGDRLPGDVVAAIASPVTGAIDAAETMGAQAAVNAGLQPYGGGHFDPHAPGLYVPPHALHGEEAVNQVKSDINTTTIGLGAERPPISIAAAAPKAGSLAARVNAFDQAGVTPSLAAAGSPRSATLGKFAAEDPIVGGVPRARLQASVAETGQAADRIAAGYGSAGSPQAAGQAIQAGGQRFANVRVPATPTAPAQTTSFSAKAGALYDRAFGAIDTALAGKTTPGASQVATPATSAALHQLTNGTQSAAIGDLIRDPTIAKVAQAVENSQGQLSFSDLRQLRTWVRTAQDNPELRQTIGQANLSRLEGALTSDIYSNAATLGSPQLAAQLRRADQFYAAGQQRIANSLTSAFKAQSPEQAYGSLIAAAQGGGRADIARLLGVKRSLQPGEWGDVASTTLRNLGNPTPGQASVAAGDDAFSVSTFVTNYNRLSPAGRDILFGAKGGGGAQATSLRAQLDNLARVADMQKGIERAANTSNTATSGRTLGTIAGLANPLTTVPTILGLAGVRGLGEAMTNPAFVRWMAGTARAPANALPSRLDQLARLAATTPSLAGVAAQVRAQLTQGSEGGAAVPAATPRTSVGVQ